MVFSFCAVLSPKITVHVFPAYFLAELVVCLVFERVLPLCVCCLLFSFGFYVEHFVIMSGLCVCLLKLTPPSVEAER